jgi:hypothetical protein
MTRKPTADDGFDRATLREAANHLTNGLIDRMHDILKHTMQENLKDVRERGQTILDVVEAAAVLRTIHDYTFMASRRLDRIASLIQYQNGSGNDTEYLDLCDGEGPGCDCEMVCKFRKEPPNG